jgi:hypothetical protein
MQKATNYVGGSYDQFTSSRNGFNPMRGGALVIRMLCNFFGVAIITEANPSVGCR